MSPNNQPMKNLFALILLLLTIASFTRPEKEDLILNLQDEDRLTIKYTEVSGYLEKLPVINVYKQEDIWIGTFEGLRSNPKKVKLNVEDMHRLVAFEEELRQGKSTGDDCDGLGYENVRYEFELNGQSVRNLADPSCNRGLFQALAAELFDLDEVDYKPIVKERA